MVTAVLFLIVAAVGSVLRHVVRTWTDRCSAVPLGTLAVNLVGSFLLGLVVGWDPPGATVVGTAGLGALTTFSTFSADVVGLRAQGTTRVVAYAGASVVGGVALAWLGLHLAG